MSDARAAERLPEEAYTVLDRLDEKMIGSELAGLVDYGAQELVYSFKIEGKEVTGLSWPGAKALARWMASKGHPMDAEEKEIIQDDEAWYADVKIVDKETGLGLWGTSKCSKLKEIHILDENRRWAKNPDGTWKVFTKPNEFARTVALNKAQRNGILAHVPDKLIAEFIRKAVEEGRVRKVPPAEVEGFAPRKTVKSEQSIKEQQPAEEKPAKEMEAATDTTPQATDGTPVPPADLSRVLDALEGAGLDASILNILLVEGKLIVSPKRFLGDVWGVYSDALVRAGLKWISAGKQSHWEQGNEHVERPNQDN